LGAIAVGFHACSVNLPPDVSSDYVRIPIVSSKPPHRVRYVLVPEACLTHDQTAKEGLGKTLPPGCANAYNLLRMAERKGDVVKGQRLGKAYAVKTAKAAQKYLDGDTGTLGASPPADTVTGVQQKASDTVNSPANPIKPKQ
jgi:hypothetical protein